MTLGAPVPRLNWVRDRKEARPKTGVDRDSWNEIANYQDDLFDLFDDRHDATTGDHDTPEVAQGEGFIEGTTGYAFVDPTCIITTTFTLQRSQGIIASIAKQSQGRYRVTLSKNLVQPYFPVVRAFTLTAAESVPGGCSALGNSVPQPFVTIISATQFDVTLKNIAGTEVGRDSTLWIHGESA